MHYHPDIELVFVPQWSPFQPPLSIPALRAWIDRCGYKCESYDANLALYHWLFSDDAKSVLRSQIDERGDAQIFMGYRAALDQSKDFQEDLLNLSKISSECSDEERIAHTYRAVKSLQTYLSVVSGVSGDFTITPYSFRTTGDMLDIDFIRSFIANPPKLIETFVVWYCEEFLSRSDCPVGLSCIGQEQLLFTLLFAKFLNRAGRRVVVGGTIFSRIQQRGLLPVDWCVDGVTVIVHNEGERPLSSLLALRDWSPDALSAIEGLTFLRGDELVTTKVGKPLVPAEIPDPDFDGLPLSSYLTPEITLPVLSSRGCYWGHCEFCYHGMVYGEKYAAYKIDAVVDTITRLSRRYNARFFSFNDEAVPPKVMRAIGESDLSNLGIRFQALFKFENYYTKDDFSKLYNAGLRSLYVGLESANERVLASMRKNTKRTVMVSNLTDAAQAGIWVHCFLFFGFPGETEAEANDTYRFILENSEIIGSFGAGNFEFEHGAPISRHTSDFPINLSPSNSKRVDVYANYEPIVGISQQRAATLSTELHEEALDIVKYRAAQWIPRELFLIMLSYFDRTTLISAGNVLFSAGDILPNLPLRDFISVSSGPDGDLFINRLNRKILRISSSSAHGLKLARRDGWTSKQVENFNSWILKEFATPRSPSSHPAV